MKTLSKSPDPAKAAVRKLVLPLMVMLTRFHRSGSTKPPGPTPSYILSSATSAFSAA